MIGWNYMLCVHAYNLQREAKFHMGLQLSTRDEVPIQIYFWIETKI